MKGYWREVPSGERVSKLFVINHLVESGYKAEHAPAFVDACKDGGFVVCKGTPNTFYEYVELDTVTY